MAWRYREIEIEDGDVLDPRDWNENVEPYANEINGFLDRDNLNEGQVAMGAEIAWNKDVGPIYAVEYVKCPDRDRRNQFASDPQNLLLGTDPNHWSQTLDTDTQSWQVVQSVEVSIPTTSDELFIIEAGFQLQHDIYKEVDKFSTKTATSRYFNDHLFVRAMVTVDGFQVAEAGPIPGVFTKIGVVLMGVLPVSAGSHDVKMFVKLERAAKGVQSKWRNATAVTIEERNLMVLRRMR